MSDNPFAPPGAALNETQRVRKWPQLSIAIAGVFIAAFPVLVERPVLYALHLAEGRMRMIDFRGFETWVYLMIACFLATIAFAILEWRAGKGGAIPFVWAAAAQVAAVLGNWILFFA
jgi:hypothetical protein